MIISFCGHSAYKEQKEHEKMVLKILNERVGNTNCEFFLGEYGNFDKFAYRCAKNFCANHTNSKLVFITPYASLNHKKMDIQNIEERFDDIVYPSLENVPLRYAITHRNRWIVEQSDLIIAFIEHNYGGAYSTYIYAKRKNKEVHNLFKTI